MHETAPGDGLKSDEDLLAFARGNGTTLYHADGHDGQHQCANHHDCREGGIHDQGGCSDLTRTLPRPKFHAGHFLIELDDRRAVFLGRMEESCSCRSTGWNLPDMMFYVAGGSVQATSRTLLVDQVAHERVTEAFGLYALSGKATAFIGPLAIALTTAYFAREAFGFSPQDAQRLGVTPVVVLFVIACHRWDAIASD